MSRTVFRNASGLPNTQPGHHRARSWRRSAARCRSASRATTAIARPAPSSIGGRRHRQPQHGCSAVSKASTASRPAIPRLGLQPRHLGQARTAAMSSRVVLGGPQRRAPRDTRHAHSCSREQCRRRLDPPHRRGDDRAQLSEAATEVAEVEAQSRPIEQAGVPGAIQVAAALRLQLSLLPLLSCPSSCCRRGRPLPLFPDRRHRRASRPRPRRCRRPAQARSRLAQ